MTRLRFERSASTVLDASGDGQVEFRAPPAGHWLVTQMTVVTSTADTIPEARVYARAVGDPNLIEGTFTGSRDTSDSEHVVLAGTALIVRWEAGDPGSTATARISGWQYPYGELERS